MKRSQLLDLLWSFQQANGYITDSFVKECSKNLNMSEIELEGVISFYHFFKRKPGGDITIYLNNSIISQGNGYQRVKEAFERETGTEFDHVDPSGKFELRETACIGLSDQEPAALINFYPFTNLTTLKVKRVIAKLKKGTPVDTIYDEVLNHVRHVPPEDKSIFFRDYKSGVAVNRLETMGSDGVIEEVKKAQIRGMGGAYFPTGIKMQGCKDAVGDKKYIVCNADEGEPGTFKDRVLLSKLPGLVMEGMISSGYAVGANQGIIYLRAEYTWLLERLKNTLAMFRENGLLGKNVGGIEGFDFHIRIQLGAGSYVCGEETAMLNSMEGKRGEPRTKLYFPTERGFLNKPTQVNNVETFAAIARAVELGADHFLNTGTPSSPGTKLLSISGDCHQPGIFEIEWGTPVATILDMCKAEDPFYLQISGPSGQCISRKEYNRKIAIDDLRCGGSFMIFNSSRDILQILHNFTSFFKNESCGVCTPCRAGNFIIERKLEKIANNLAYSSDYDDIKQWGKIMKVTSRCGLGQAATSALTMALDKFPEFFDTKVDHEKEGLNKKFDMAEALIPYEKFKY